MKNTFYGARYCKVGKRALACSLAAAGIVGVCLFDAYKPSFLDNIFSKIYQAYNIFSRPEESIFINNPIDEFEGIEDNTGTNSSPRIKNWRELRKQNLYNL